MCVGVGVFDEELGWFSSPANRQRSLSSPAPHQPHTDSSQEGIPCRRGIWLQVTFDYRAGAASYRLATARRS